MDSILPGRSLERRCFTCELPLVTTDREGVEIDYCPSCRSVWLDRGELEKLVDRLASPYPDPDAGGLSDPWFDDAPTAPRAGLGAFLDVR